MNITFLKENRDFRKLWIGQFISCFVIATSPLVYGVIIVTLRKNGREQIVDG